MEPVEVVQQWQRGQRIDGRAANEAYLDDEIRLLLPGLEAIVGKRAASTHFESVEDSFKPLLHSTVDGPYTVFVSQGDLVAHRFRWNGETKDGQLVDLLIFNLYVVRDGKITHFEEHFDTLARAQYAYGYDANPQTRTLDADSYILSS